jgi:hypothetical protein
MISLRILILKVDNKKLLNTGFAATDYSLEGSSSVTDLVEFWFPFSYF